MRPFSFTRNLGGLQKVYDAIRAGYVAGVTVKQFRKRCGLNSDLSLLVTEFFLATQVHGNEEYILADTLIAQTLTQPYSRLLARLYFFALNLNMPGERINPDHRSPAEMQNTYVRDHLFVDDGFRALGFDKDRSIEPVVKHFGDFKTHETLRKWVNNYGFIAEQCDFVPTPGGGVETFADTWGALALRLFFDRYASEYPAPDANALAFAAQSRQLHKLIGVPRSWLDERINGAAQMFVSDQGYMFLGFTESAAERRAARRGTAPPPATGEIQRRNALTQQIKRRSDNIQFLQDVYAGECQLSGVKLFMPNGSFSVDCAHIRPLGNPHSGWDETGNMLSLSPTMHRLFDRGCIRIDPETLAVRLLHGNNLPHRAHLLIRGDHTIRRENLAYHIKRFADDRNKG
jgi:hypothetical protein